MQKLSKVILLGVFVFLSLAIVSYAQKIEIEPNNSFTKATTISVNDTVKFTMIGDKDIDVAKINLDSTYIYYISGYKHANQWDLCETQTNNGNTDKMPFLEAEWYFSADTTKQIQLSELANGYRYGMPRNTGYVPARTGTYYLKLYTYDVNTADYWIRVVRGPKVSDLGKQHEPDGTTALADAQQKLEPLKTIRADLFPINDLDIYKLDGVAGKSFEITCFPPPELVHRDVDTDIALFDQNGVPAGNVILDGKGLFSNDDYRSGITWSRITGRFPTTGTYYLAVFTWYSKYADNLNFPDDRLFANQGEYLLTLKVGEKIETESNGTFETSTYVAGNDTVVAEMSGASDVDVFRMTLNKNHIYYITSYKYGNEWQLCETQTNNGNSDKLPNLEVEFYSADDLTKAISPAGEIPGGNRYGMLRLTGYVPQKTGDYYLKLYTYDSEKAKYYLRVVEGPWVSDLGKAHEPDNTTTQADAAPTLTPFKPINADLFPINDLDVYRIEGEAGKSFEIAVFPPATKYPPNGLAFRDLDTDIALFDQNGLPAGKVILDGKGLYSNDDYRSGIVWSKINGVFPTTGVYYLSVFTWYSKYADNLNYPDDALRANQGEYTVTLTVGQEIEAEPNNSFNKATFIAVNDTLKARMTGADDVDVYRMNLSSAKIYYITSYKYGTEWPLCESGSNNGNVDEHPFLEVEVYAADDTTKKLDPASELADGNRFGMLRLTGWIPPKTGGYYIKFYTYDTDQADYFLRVVEGPWVSEMGKSHEPDNTSALADALPALQPFKSVSADMFPINDLDVYKVEGTAGQPFEITVFPPADKYPPAGLGFRDIDTDIALFDQTGVPSGKVKLDGQGLFSNDDYRSGITWSRITGVFPYTGKYYLAVFTWYSTYADNLDFPDDRLFANRGEYKLTLKTGLAVESEPNNAFKTASYVSAGDTIQARMSGAQDTDVFRMTLSSARMYYITTFKYGNEWDLCWTQKNNGNADKLPLLEAEVYAADDTTKDLKPAGEISNGNRYGMARLTGWIPPKTGDYYIKLYTYDTDQADYWLRIVEGPFLADLGRTHEPDNTINKAASQPMLTIGSSVTSDLFPINDLDIYKVNGAVGQKFEIWVKPIPGLGFRDLDTDISLFAPGDSIPSGTLDGKGWLSNDDVFSGITWSRITGTFEKTGTYHLAVYTWYGKYADNVNYPDDALHANRGQYLVTMTDWITAGIDDRGTGFIPSSFALNLNYPNPFNPTTTISYDLPQKAKVDITIYNLLGKKVCTLVDKEMQAGQHHVVWNATDENGFQVSSGVYFFKMTTDKFSKTNKMILMK